MSEQISAFSGDPYDRSGPAVSEEQALHWSNYGPLKSRCGKATFPDLKTVRAFRKERSAIRQAHEALRPAQVRGLITRSSGVGAGCQD